MEMGSFRGVVSNVLDCKIVVSAFAIPFGLTLVGKV